MRHLAEKHNLYKDFIHVTGCIHQKIQPHWNVTQTQPQNTQYKYDQRMKTINRDEKGLCNAWRTELGLRGICHLYQGILFLVEQNLDSVNVSVDSCRDKREMYISNTPWTQFTANNTLSADLSVSLLKAESDSNRSHAHRVILKDISHTEVCLWCWQLLNCGDNSKCVCAQYWEFLPFIWCVHTTPNLQIISRLCICEEMVSSLTLYPLLPS